MAEPANEEKLMRLAIYAVATVLIVIMLTIGGCTMHSNAVEPDLERELTGQVTAQMEVEKIKQKGEANKIVAIKALIESGTNPVAARCAIIGWGTGTDASVCLAAGASANSN